MPGSDVRHQITTEEFPAHLFADPARSTKSLQTLHEIFITSGSSFELEQFSTAVRNHLINSPAPDTSLMNFLRFAEATLSKASLFNDLLHYPVLLEVLVKVFGHSQYFSDILVRDPELFRWLTTSEKVLLQTESVGHYADEVERIERTFRRPERRLDALRRLYRREILRIGTRDILGHADLVTATQEISNLADALINASYRLATKQLEEKYGDPPPTSFAVIGLGKLGGSELNYSSDIDLIFVYNDEGEKECPGGRSCSFHEYFSRLAEKIVQNLSSSSAEGHIYRVDTRLRPESGAGPLARSLNSYLFYYESRGELWERQMLIKARPVGGDLAFGYEFIRRLDPFVYPRTHFQHPGEAAARIKARIENEASTEQNIKLRPGGIRDIEFVVQILQLQNGGRIPSLKEPNTLKGLQALAEHTLLSQNEEQVLAKAYIFFRTIEHRLQMVLNTQTHTLPDDPRSQLALARRLGFANVESMHEALQRNLAAVRQIFEEVLPTVRGGPASEIAALLDGATSEDQLSDVLRKYGLKDTRKGVRNLRSLMLGSSLTGARELDSRARDAFRAVAMKTFEGIALTTSPDMTLSNLALLASAQQFPEQFYGQLKEDGFRKLVLRTCAVSQRFVKGLVQYPMLLEEIIAVKPMETLQASSGFSSDELVDFKNRNEARSGIQNILGVSSFEQLTEGLTDIADAVIRSVVMECQESMRQKKCPVAVLALGKLGTRELNFDADLDLVFVSDARKTEQAGNVERFAQELVKRLQAVTPRGRLYDVDLRLRPEGKNAPLVTEIESYLKYLLKRASLWERQSLTRLRFVCGREEIGRAVLDSAERFVYETPLPDRWTESLVSMRKAMETRSRTSRHKLLDIKLAPGAMVDIEFVAQMVQLHCGRQSREHRGARRIRDILGRVPPSLLSGEDAEFLVKSFSFYRELEKLLRVVLEEKGTILPDGEKLDLLAGCYDCRFTGKDLQEMVFAAMKQVRALFVATVSRLSRDH